MFPIRDHNPSGRTPYVVYALLALNVLVFLYVNVLELSPGGAHVFAQQFGLTPALGVNSGYLSYMFLHAGFLHLAGNMLFLWIFGDNLEDIMGHIGFLLFYLVSGALAGGLHAMSDPASLVPLVGASGAIAGVLGGYLLLFPRARVDVLFIFIIIFKILPIPAWVVLGVWFGIQILNGLASDPSLGGVAYWAHAGGFVVGLILTLPAWARLGGTRYWRHTHGVPPHPEATYSPSSIPVVKRRR